MAYVELSTQRVTAENLDYAYRDLGEGDVPLVLLRHFPGSLAVDNVGVALSFSTGGFVAQEHHQQFAADVRAFLAEAV